MSERKTQLSVFLEQQVLLAARHRAKEMKLSMSAVVADAAKESLPELEPPKESAQPPQNVEEAALAMLKAWNTGHPGGVATIHANSAADALRRIEDLVGEASQVIPNQSIASAVNLVIYIERVSGAAGRIVRHIAQIDGFDGHNYVANDAS